jgi:hypothetical protein
VSNPLAQSSDLATFLGQEVDDARATMLLAIAQAYCEDVVSPLPASALGIILSAAARAYVNPAQDAAVGTGPYTVTRASSVYLTRAERAALRQAAGRGGGGSTSMLVPAANNVQVVTVDATAGTFTLSLDGVTSAPIAYNASAAAVQSALAALSNVGSGNVTVSTVVGTYTVTFVNALGNQPINQLVADGSSLTGSVSTGVVTAGNPAPGSGLPAWEYDYNTTVYPQW